MAALLSAESVAVGVGFVHVQAEVVQAGDAASASSPKIVTSSGKSEVAPAPVPEKAPVGELCHDAEIAEVTLLRPAAYHVLHGDAV